MDWSGVNVKPVAFTIARVVDGRMGPSPDLLSAEAIGALAAVLAIRARGADFEAERRITERTRRIYWPSLRGRYRLSMTRSSPRQTRRAGAGG